MGEHGGFLIYVSLTSTQFLGKLRLCSGAIKEIFAALPCQLVKMRPAFPY